MLSHFYTEKLTTTFNLTPLHIKIIMHDLSPTELGATQFHQEGIKNGKFLIQKCSSCENFQFFPRSFCITCSSDSLDWIAASGNGVVYSTTTVRRKAEIGGDFNVSLIDLDEGVRVMGNVVDVDPSEVFIGLKVRLEIIQENGQGKVQFKSGTTK